MVDSKGIETPNDGSAVRLCAIPAVLALIVAAGCSGLGTRKTNVVEIQLRQQRTENDELRRELESTQIALADTQQKISALREAQPGSSASVKLASSSTDSISRVARLELNPLLSGGLDRDNLPGDELLSVLVTTADRFGSAIRADGKLSVTAFDYAMPADSQQVGHWDWEAEETASLWLDGLVGAGYRLTEEWQKPPRSTEIVLHARFVSVDGQQFDATATVKIEVPLPGGDDVRTPLSVR